MKKIRVGIVNYLNTKPLLYGIERAANLDQAELLPDYPANVARQLLNDEIDLGLVPVAVIPRLKEAHIVSDYCIGCDGPVASVAIFCDRPLEEASKLLLDYQSRTSVNLARILVRDHWKLDIPVEDGGEDFLEKIKGDTAGVCIGDRALRQRQLSAHVYDLGEAWKQHTQLPFVFAAWVANKPLDSAFLKAFNEANGVGLNHLDQVLEGLDYPYFNLRDYYSQYIQYRLDAPKRQALQLFLEKLKEG